MTLRHERRDQTDDVDGTQPPLTGVRPVGRGVRRHLLFICVLLAATALRVVAVLAYPGVLWFTDSRSYLGVAVRPAPYPARPQGYAFFLRALEPAHSFLLVAIGQHLLVLAAAVALYALMRRRFAVPRWAATLACVPLLFDGAPVDDINTWKRFTPRMSGLTGDFAKRAILAQPDGYLRSVRADLIRTFEWNRVPYPTRANARSYRFPEHIKPLEPVVSVPGATAVRDYRAYGHTGSATRVVEPYAGFLRAYQDYARLPGTVFGLILLTGLAGMVPLWRRRGRTAARSASVEGGGGRRVGGSALLPWATALAMVLVPPVTASFGYRYVLPAAPLACAAAAITIAEARAARGRGPET